MIPNVCKTLFSRQKELEFQKVNALASQEAYKALEDRIAPPRHVKTTK